MFQKEEGDYKEVDAKFREVFLRISSIFGYLSEITKEKEQIVLEISQKSKSLVATYGNYFQVLKERRRFFRPKTVLQEQQLFISDIGHSAHELLARIRAQKKLLVPDKETGGEAEMLMQEIKTMPFFQGMEKSGEALVKQTISSHKSTILEILASLKRLKNCLTEEEQLIGHFDLSIKDKKRFSMLLEQFVSRFSEYHSLEKKEIEMCRSNMRILEAGFLDIFLDILKQAKEAKDRQRSEISSKITQEKKSMEASLADDDSVEARKLRIASELYEFYRNPVKSDLFLWNINIIEEMNKRLIEVFRQLENPEMQLRLILNPEQIERTYAALKQYNPRFKHTSDSAELLSRLVEDIAEVLENQDKYIEKMRKNIGSGRFYFKYFLIKTSRIPLEELPLKHNFNKIFFTLLNSVKTEFTEYKKLLYPILGDNIKITDVDNSRAISYWSHKNLFSICNRLSSIAERYISVGSDFIFQEEVSYSPEQIESLPLNAKKRILRVFEKTNRLFAPEMGNKPIGGNVLFHSTGVYNLVEIIKEGEISSKYEKRYLEGEKIPGKKALGSAGISFNSNIGSHFGFGWSGKEGGTGGIFMLPLIKALRREHILIVPQPCMDPFEILLLHKRINKPGIGEFFEHSGSIQSSLDLLEEDLQILRLFYEDTDSLRSRFFSHMERLDMDDFVLEVLLHGHRPDAFLHEDQIRIIRRLPEEFPELNMTIYDFSASKSAKHREKALTLIRQASEHSEYKTLFEGLFVNFKKDINPLKEVINKPFGYFFLKSRDFFNYWRSETDVKSFLFCMFIDCLMEEGRRKEIKFQLDKVSICMPEQVHASDNIPLWGIIDNSLKEGKTGGDTLSAFINHILKTHYNGKEFEELSLQEVTEIFEKRLPEILYLVRVKRYGFLDTKIFLKDTILLLPMNCFSIWEDFFKKTGNRPYIVFYYKGDILDQKDTSKPDNIIVQFLKRCRIDFNPMFTQDRAYKDFMKGRYFEGTKYTLVGECTEYALKGGEI